MKACPLTSRRFVLWKLFIVTAVVATGCASNSDDEQVSSSPPQEDRISASEPTDEDEKVAIVRAQGEQAGDDQKTDVDPVEANGPIFEDWPRPQVAIVISGEQMGFLEPCGCAGLENQKGGLMRRHTMIRQRQREGWPIIALDLGGQVRRFGLQAEIKYRKSIEALTQIGYEAIGFGLQDLRLPTEQLVSVAANLADSQTPFVSANVGLFDFDSEFVARLRVVEIGGKRIGVTSIFGKTFQEQLNNDDLVIRAPEEALEKVIGPLRDQADFLVLLSHATPEASIALAQRFSHFDIVVTAGGAAEPPHQMKPIEGTRTQLVEVGHKGMYVAVLGIYDDSQPPIRYQRVPLDARFNDSPEMQDVMVDYQSELRTLGLDGLGLSGSRHPTGGKFVGSEACADCHTAAMKKWNETPHAHATQALVDLTPPRHHDPECLSCHVTGWEAQKYFPFDSGFTDLTGTKHLRANGCENCHGPGSEHVAAEEGDVDVTDQQIKALRADMRLTLIDGEAEGQTGDGKVGNVTTRCYECHDLDNSPDFDFKKHWPEIAHYGKD